MTHWSQDAIFYHIYPLGLTGAPARNDFHAAPVQRLEQLYPWLDHIQRLGCNALYLGPLFESTAHGYDTADYYAVDRRLGSNDTLAAFSREAHRRGLRLVLDGVFNHVGRDFWAFRDVQTYREQSAYRGWFAGLDFSRHNRRGDGFTYEGWSGHDDLVKLNLAHPDARRHLLDAVTRWVEWFEIDGLRLDAADVVDHDFMAALAAHARGLRSDFWLMGEMVFGDYRHLARPGLLDSTTNYEVYKSLYSSFAERNLFEVAYALSRQSGAGGIYRDLALYTFADNHDVNRVASQLRDPAHLYPLYALLFAMPGVPSIYYASEWGIPGARSPHDDRALRPALSLDPGAPRPQPDLPAAIARLARLRHELPALRHGGYTQLFVAAEQLAFLRLHPAGDVLVAVNAAPAPAALELRLPLRSGALADRLNPGERFPIREHVARLELPPYWARVLAVEPG